MNEEVTRSYTGKKTNLWKLNAMMVGTGKGRRKYEIPLSVVPPAPPPFWAIRHTSEDCRRRCFAGYKEATQTFSKYPELYLEAILARKDDWPLSSLF